MNLNIDKYLKNFSVISKAETYWKGEGFFLVSNEITELEKIKDIYSDSFVKGNINFKNHTFLKKICPLTHIVLNYLVENKEKLEDDFYFLYGASLRLRLYDLDYQQKLEDDLYLKSSVTKLVDLIFNSTSLNSFFNCDFTFNSKDFANKVPLRNNSETLLYLSTFLLYLDSIKSKSSLRINLELYNTYLFTIITSEGNTTITKNNDFLFELLSCNFQSDSKYLLGQLNTDSSYFIWNS